MNRTLDFGTRDALTAGVQVSSKVVSSVPSEGVQAASIPASGADFKNTFAAACQSAAVHKPQGISKQTDEKKAIREKQPARDATSTPVTVADTSAPLPTAVSLTVPSLYGASNSSTHESTTSDRGTAVSAAAAAVANDGEGNGLSTEADAAVGIDTLQPPSSAISQTTPFDGVGKSETEPVNPVAAVAGISPLSSLQTSSTDMGDGTAAPMKDGKAAGNDLTAMDGAAQASTLSDTTPPQIPDNLHLLISPTDNMPKPVAAQTMSTVENGLGSTVVPKGSLSKQTSVPGKDRSTTSDVHGKGKSEDTGSLSSGLATDPSFVTKVPGFAANQDYPVANSHNGGVGGDAAQQGMPSGTASAAAANLSASQNVTSADTGSSALQNAASNHSTEGTHTQEVPVLNSAHLLQSMGQSEMKLGMHSAEFGSISINTSLTHQALSAQISISHSALGQALALHLPSIEEKLGSAYGLNARVEVRDSSSSAAGDSGRQSQDRRHGQSSGSAPLSPVPGAGMLASATTTTTSLLANSSRLDIRI